MGFILANVFNFQDKYVLSISVFFLSVIVAVIVGWFIKNVFGRLAAKTETKADDVIISKTWQAVVFLIITAGLRVALNSLDIKDVTVNHIVDSITILLATYIVIAAGDVCIEEYGRYRFKKYNVKTDPSLLPFFHKAYFSLCVIVSIMFLLHEWEINLTPVLAGLGVAGLVLGFALKSTIENVFGGVSILLDRTFKIGDVVQIETGGRVEGGDTGTVVDIGIRSTKILAFDGDIITVPNGQIAVLRVKNLKQPTPKVRADILFSAAYGSDVENVKKTVLLAIKGMTHLLSEPEPKILFESMADSSLNFKAMIWIDSYENRLLAKEEATKRIYNALNKAKIDIPFPTRTVYLKRK